MYSLICKRCGRKLKSEVSRERGYGPACYKKVASDEKRDTEIEEVEQIEEIDGQIDIEEFFNEMS